VPPWPPHARPLPHPHGPGTLWQWGEPGAQEEAVPGLGITRSTAEAANTERPEASAKPMKPMKVLVVGGGPGCDSAPTGSLGQGPKREATYKKASPTGFERQCHG
jgi:hypothetical protein